MENKLYVTLGGPGQAEFEEKHSVFIGYARPVRSEEEASGFIAQIKAKHKDATHNVFGYTMKNGILSRYSDDGEPQGTAGMPVLDVIRKSGVDDACVVVTRYFGGILLGAGGLVRAYGAAAKAAINAAGIATYEPFTEFSVKLSYSDYQRLSAELPKYPVLTDGVEYAEEVCLRGAVKSEAFPFLSARVQEMTAGKASLLVTGQRFDTM